LVSFIQIFSRSFGHRSCSKHNLASRHSGKQPDSSLKNATSLFLAIEAQGTPIIKLSAALGFKTGFKTYNGETKDSPKDTAKKGDAATSPFSWRGMELAGLGTSLAWGRLALPRLHGPK